MTEVTLRTRGLEKRFSGFHLGPLDMNVPEGAIYGFIGPNGAGKTTTIDLVMGMGRPSAGRIEVFGMDHATKEAEVKARIGYVSQDLSFRAWGRIGRLIRFWRSFYPDWDDDYCDTLLGRLKLDVQKRIGTLSFGERTKLGLLLALSHRPPFLLLDEPLAGLDAVSKHEVFEELLDAVQDEERTVLISSHNLDDIERFADHVGMLAQGKLILEGPTTELVERFRMIDCTASNGGLTGEHPGLYPQRQKEQRHRILADLSQDPIERLKASGMTDIQTTPVSLEELFVALMRE